MKRLCYLVLVGLVSLGVAGVASAIPQLINYQGYLTDDFGVPVADGNYGLTFSIYDVETGGAAVWTETHAAVPVTNGLFNVILGVDSPLTLPFDVDYWLGVQIGVEPELPRIRFTSVAYSYRADLADTAQYALSANVPYVDSASVAANAWNWAGNPWGAEYPHANMSDTADYAWNSDQLDGYQVGNSPGQIPISNGIMCTNLNADMVDGLHASDIVASSATNAADWVILTGATPTALDSVTFNLPRAGNVLAYGSTYFNIYDPANTIVQFYLAVDSLPNVYVPTVRFYNNVAAASYAFGLGGHHSECILSLPAGPHKVYLVGAIIEGTGPSETNYRSVGVVYLGPGVVKESSRVTGGIPVPSENLERR